MRVLVAVAVAASLAIGCGGSKPPAEEPDSDWGSLSSPSEPPPKWNEPAPDEPPPAQEPGSTSGGDDVKPVPDTYDISVADCRLLARTYGAATRADEGAKLSDKLKPERREQALRDIAKVAKKLEDKWFDSCAESLVGMTRDRESLDCAIKAKTVSEFDVCLNGPAE